MRRVDFICTVLILVLIHIPSLCCAGKKELKLRILHPVVGEVIDAEENKKFNLFGGEAQVSNIAKLLTENWIFTSGDDFMMFSGGIRLFGENLAVDFGLVTSDEAFSDGGFPFFPWVDFAVNW